MKLYYATVLANGNETGFYVEGVDIEQAFHNAEVKAKMPSFLSRRPMDIMVQAVQLIRNSVSLFESLPTQQPVG
jgi:hypothetical protein